MRVTMLVLLLPIITACTDHLADLATVGGPLGSGPDPVAALWVDTVTPYLEQDLWLPGEAYDAGHALMVPLHYAFESNSKTLLNEFAEHFRRFDTNWAEQADNKIIRFQYMYLVSQFIALSAATENEHLVPEELAARLAEDIRHQWLEADFWQWQRDPFVGLKERVEWKLASTPTEPSYLRGITDEAVYVFAISADLYSARNSWPSIEDNALVLADIIDAAFAVLTRRSVLLANSGWLFQPGIWTDHRDYLYAGHKDKLAGIEPIRVEGIAEDSAHSHRMPLWLESLERATVSDRPEYWAWFRYLRQELADHFVNTILRPPTVDFPSYRLTNYMDGRNGLYRWQNATQGANNGYGPYELSGFIAYGWWGFLRNTQISTIFSKQARRFPLSENVVATYVGPNTTRERNPLMSHPGFFTNGFAELNVILAAKLRVQNSE